MGRNFLPITSRKQKKNISDIIVDEYEIFQEEMKNNMTAVIVNSL